MTGGEFAEQVAALQAAARDRQKLEGRKALTFTGYAIAAFFICTLHVPGWLGFWMFWVSMFSGLRAIPRS
jgi:hypothetical protein